MKRRIIMNRNCTVRVVVAALVITFVVSVAPSAQAASGKCSLSKVAGTYGLTTTGSIPGIGPVAAVGLITIDASGNISGSRSEEHTSELQSHSFISYAVFCLK